MMFLSPLVLGMQAAVSDANAGNPLALKLRRRVNAHTLWSVCLRGHFLHKVCVWAFSTPVASMIKRRIAMAMNV